MKKYRGRIFIVIDGDVNLNINGNDDQEAQLRRSDEGKILSFSSTLLTETINFLFFHLQLIHFICLSSPNLIELFIDRKRLSIGIWSFSSWTHTYTRTPSSYSNHNHHYHRMCMCGVSRMSCHSLHSSTIPSSIHVYMCVKLDCAILISFSYLSSHRERKTTRSANVVINVNDVGLLTIRMKMTKTETNLNLILLTIKIPHMV